MKSDYSLGRAILTLNKPSDKFNPNKPLSVFDIAKEHKLSKVIVVDDSISGCLEAQQNAKKCGVELVYGLRLNCIANIEDKTEAALKTLHKVVIFMKNTAGYKDLIKITSVAAKKGFYYTPNIDCKHLKEMWSPNLALAIPFYDSFLFKNTLEGHLCIPDFSFTKPVFFIENSGLPFDKLMQEKVIAYAASVGAPVVPARSVYCHAYSDFLALLTFRAIHERSTIQKPNLEHFSSDKFCFEEWLLQEKEGNTIIK